MTAHNDHTGDAIRTKAGDPKAYERGGEGVERECCGAFLRSPHRSTCPKSQGKHPAPEETK